MTALELGWIGTRLTQIDTGLALDWGWIGDGLAQNRLTVDCPLIGPGSAPDWLRLEPDWHWIGVDWDWIDAYWHWIGNRL